MEKYNIYAGLGGGFGGAQYLYTVKTENREEAEEIAYEEALDLYESFAGNYNLLSWSDCANQLGIDPCTEDDNLIAEVDELYNEEMENWIEYYAILTSKDKETSKEELIYETN